MRNASRLALAALLTAGCSGAADSPGARPTDGGGAPAPRAGAGPTRVLVVPAFGEALHVTVSVPAEYGLDAGRPWRLVEEGGGGEDVPAELVAAEAGPGTAPLLARREARFLAAVIPPGQGDAPRRFLLRPRAEEDGPAFDLRPVSGVSLGLFEGGRPVLVYNHGTIGREGVGGEHDRADYFHPVYGIDGEVLTDDFPADHLHHRGIFWAWPTVRAGRGEGRAFDSWIPKGFRYGFERWTFRHAGSRAAALGAETAWLAGGRKIVREEMLAVVHASRGGWRAIDLELRWTAVDEPVVLKGADGKGYGGLSFRFAPRKDTVITAPGGRTDKDLLATRLAWADLAGAFAGREGPSGAAVLVAPDHPGYPPMWMTRHYGVLCVGWPGLEEVALEPGRTVTCRYRVLVHRGSPGARELQAASDAYAKGLQARWADR